MWRFEICADCRTVLHTSRCLYLTIADLGFVEVFMYTEKQKWFLKFKISLKMQNTTNIITFWLFSVSETTSGLTVAHFTTTSSSAATSENILVIDLLYLIQNKLRQCPQINNFQHGRAYFGRPSPKSLSQDLLL